MSDSFTFTIVDLFLSSSLSLSFDMTTPVKKNAALLWRDANPSLFLEGRPYDFNSFDQARFYLHEKWTSLVSEFLLPEQFLEEEPDLLALNGIIDNDSSPEIYVEETGPFHWSTSFLDQVAAKSVKSIGCYISRKKGCCEYSVYLDILRGVGVMKRSIILTIYFVHIKGSRGFSVCLAYVDLDVEDVGREKE